MKRIVTIVITILMTIAAHVQAVPVYNLISGLTTEKDAPKAPGINVEATNNGYKVTRCWCFLQLHVYSNFLCRR